MPSTATSIIDGVSTSVAVKAPVKTVSTTNLTLSGQQTVGGVACVDGDRVLAKDQTDATQNGIYVVSTGSWSRAQDFDGNRDVVKGTLVVSTDANDSLYYRVTSDDPITIDSSDIDFEIVGSLSKIFPLTTTEAAALATPIDFSKTAVPEDVQRYGATDTGVDVTTSINNTISALNAGTIKGGAVLLPGDANSVYGISASITLPSRPSGDNHTRWYSIRGMGRGASRVTALTGLANSPMISAAGQDSLTYSFYREFKDFYLNGAGIANRGIELYYNQHYKVENVFITQLDDGSSVGSAAGLRVFGAICCSFRDVKVHDGDGYGIYAHGGSGNFFNANLVAGGSFLNLLKDGMYFSGGVNGCAFIGGTSEGCEYGARFAGYSSTSFFMGGWYFELNRKADVYLGEESAAAAAVVVGSYFNGYNGIAQDNDYTPIKIKFSNGALFLQNKVNNNTKSPSGYYLANCNIAGGGPLTDTQLIDNHIVGLSPATAPNQVYNLPGTWVYLRNVARDPIFAPCIHANAIRGRWPYGGWTISVTGTGTAVRSGTDILGAPALLMTRPAASTCSVSQAFTIQAHFKGRFVTFAIPVTALVASQSIDVTIAPNGTSPQATTITESTLGANERTIIYALAFVPTDATTVTCTISLTTDTGQFIIGHPCLYIGAEQWYSSEGDQDWRADAAPVAGSWNDGDKIWLLNAVAGAKMGFGCTASGSPGTWRDMPNYA